MSRITSLVSRHTPYTCTYLQLVYVSLEYNCKLLHVMHIKWNIYSRWTKTIHGMLKKIFHATCDTCNTYERLRLAQTPDVNCFCAAILQITVQMWVLMWTTLRMNCEIRSKKGIPLQILMQYVQSRTKSQCLWPRTGRLCVHRNTARTLREILLKGSMMDTINKVLYYFVYSGNYTSIENYILACGLRAIAW